MNEASAIPSAHFTALLVEASNGLGLESALREQGCQVRKVSTHLAAEEALEGADVVVISAAGFSEDDVVSLVGRAVLRASILVTTENTELAVKVARLGASTMMGTSLPLITSQIGQLLTLVELKRRVARQSGHMATSSPTSSGVVQRRSTPLPKEATPDALDALIEAAEGLVPMHRFQRVYVDYALRRFGGNKVHTAAALGIDRRTIQRWARARTDQPMVSHDEIRSS
jgi:DNA-binding NtrC family response regulator